MSAIAKTCAGLDFEDVRLVISDAGPLNYLLLIGHIAVLPILFEEIVMPSVVRDELAAEGAPPVVRAWIASLPLWMKIGTAPNPDAAGGELIRLDEGERAAIRLAEALGAQLLLMDDRQGVLAARRKGFAVIGTIGILDLATEQGLIDLPGAIDRLRKTNFRCSESLLSDLMNKHTR